MCRGIVHCEKALGHIVFLQIFDSGRYIQTMNTSLCTHQTHILIDELTTISSHIYNIYNKWQKTFCQLKKRVPRNYSPYHLDYEKEARKEKPII